MANKDKRKVVGALWEIVANFLNLNEERMREDESIWVEWAQRNNAEGGLNILYGEVRDAFKARAVVIHFVPCLYLAPFAVWNSTSGRHRPSLLGIPEHLLSLALDVIEMGACYVQSDECQRGESNDIIREALAILPEDDPRALRLFNLYHIPSHFSESSSPSGFFNFLADKKIPKKWKYLLDATMRKMVRTTLDEGNLLSNYQYHMESYLCAGIPYGLELFASQVEFVLSMPYTRKPFGLSYLSGIKKVFCDQKYQELRRKIAKKAAQHPKIKLWMGFDDGDLFLEELGDEEPELWEKVADILKKQKEEVAARWEEHRKNEKEKKTVLEKMK